MKNQKGLVPAVIVVIVLVILGVGGYFLMAKNKSPGTGILSNIQLPGGAGLNANCKLNDPELCRYMDKSAKMMESFQTGFIGTSVSTDKSGVKSETMWKMAGENSQFTTSENGKEVSNMITIGNTTYTKDMTDGKWTKFTLSSSEGKEGGGLFDASKIQEEFKDTIKEAEETVSYKALGKEACGQYQCFKYEITDTNMPDTKQYVYFDDREYIMRKMRMEDSSGFITETIFEFKPVTISAPSPVKESASGSNTMFNLPDSDQAPAVLDQVDTQKLQEEVKKMLENEVNIPATEE